jgi:hypothetical protein
VEKLPPKIADVDVASAQPLSGASQAENFQLNFNEQEIMVKIVLAAP